MKNLFYNEKQCIYKTISIKLYIYIYVNKSIYIPTKIIILFSFEFIEFH